jgi:hypothetical protein
VRQGESLGFGLAQELGLKSSGFEKNVNRDQSQKQNDGENYVAG